MSFVLKINDDMYVKGDGAKTTKAPELAQRFPTPKQARDWSKQFEGGELWEVWELNIYIHYIPRA